MRFGTQTAKQGSILLERVNYCGLIIPASKLRCINFGGVLFILKLVNFIIINKQGEERGGKMQMFILS
jgi:hypothetical protein